MAKGKGGKAADQSRLRRSIEERKLRKRVRQVTDELLDGAARFADMQAAMSPDADDAEHEFSESVDGEDEEGFVDPLVVDDPVFEEAWAAARAIIERDDDGLAGAFLGELLCTAGHEVLFVRDGRLLAPDDTAEGSDGGTVHDAEIIVVPVSGPAAAVRDALASMLADGGVVGTMRDMGMVTRDAHVRFLPGALPFDALCALPCTRLRILLRAMAAEPLGLADPMPDDGTLLAMLGGHPVEAMTVADGMGEVTHYTGFLVGIAVTAPLGVDDEDLAFDPGSSSEWVDAMRERFAARGVDVEAPTNVGDAPVEAAEARLSGYLTRANMALGLPMQAAPDRTVICRSAEGVSVMLWHEAKRKLVGPVTVPLAAYERHRASFEDTLGCFAGGEAVPMGDRGMFDAMALKLRVEHDRARASEDAVREGAPKTVVPDAAGRVEAEDERPPAADQGNVVSLFRGGSTPDGGEGGR